MSDAILELGPGERLYKFYIYPEIVEGNVTHRILSKVCVDRSIIMYSVVENLTNMTKSLVTTSYDSEEAFETAVEVLILSVKGLTQGHKSYELIDFSQLADQEDQLLHLKRSNLFKLDLEKIPLKKDGFLIDLDAYRRRRSNGTR